MATVVTTKATLLLLQLGCIFLLSMMSSGWVTPPTSRSVLLSKRSSSTARYMFDWFKPKPPSPTPAPPVEEKKETESQTEEPLAETSEEVPVEEEQKEAPKGETEKEEAPNNETELNASSDTGPPVFDTSGTHKGTVKWFNSQKGYGFIVPDGASIPDVFVHQTAIRKEGFRSLGNGESVEFKIEEDNQGRYKAVDVTGPGGVDVKGS